MKSFFFVVRMALAWGIAYGIVVSVLTPIIGREQGWIFRFIAPFLLLTAIFWATSHVHRVRLIADRVDGEALGNRHRRRIEIPLPPAQAFDMVDATIRELPHVEWIESTRDSLQLRARVKRMNPYLSNKKGRKSSDDKEGLRRNQVLATVAPGESTGSLTLICEPEGGAWLDWFLVDDGTNLENAEAITRALTRRISEQRKDEVSAARETATQKELTVAKLSLLHAQVEPHFLYNTLASAQILTRSDPPRADHMLGHLITYLRHSLPRAEESLSTVGVELERATAYLEILRIRMGERLRMQIQVPDELKTVPMPPMMLQTLVENAIKHGLEPLPGGGTIWVLARAADGKVAITVADDGRGFSEEGGGTGIGLKNIRERLRLAYGDAASFSIVANFPQGVAATITLPASPSPALPQGGGSHLFSLPGPPPGGRESFMKAVIAEDEAILRSELLALLKDAWPGLEVVAACEDGGAALEAIAAHQPDVAFLDIRMPGLTGLEVAAATSEASPRTQVVFVTAYNQYAIDAFERGAVDYLLKPIAPQRLAACVQRVKARLSSGATDTGALAAIIEELRAKLPAQGRPAPLAWITASVGKETRLIMVDDVAYFRAEDKYTVVMTAEGEALIRKPLRELLAVLDPAIFKQVHRSTIVNMKAVAGITRDDTGRGTMRLKNRPETLAVSLTFMALFRNM